MATRINRSPSPTGILREMAMQHNAFIVRPREWERIGGWEKYAYSGPLVGKPGNRGKLCTEGFVFSVDGKTTPDLRNGDIYDGATVLVLKRPEESGGIAHQSQMLGIDEQVQNENGAESKPAPVNSDDSELLTSLLQALRTIMAR